MARRILSFTLIVLVVMLVLLPLRTQPALAHERRPVGKYELVVGFLNEPAVQGEMNGIDITVTNIETKQPIEGIEKTLKAEIIAAGKTMPIELKTRFNQPGKYAGYFLPTKEGSYQFKFSGTIEGQLVTETFESGPGRFNDVEAVTVLQFPEKLPNSITLEQELTSAKIAAATAQAAANTAMTLGIAGTVLGVLGLATSLWGLRARRDMTTTKRPTPEVTAGR